METGFLYAIGAAITWGLVYAIEQKVLITVSPMMLVFFNAIVAGILVLPFLVFGGASFKTIVASGKTNAFLILFSVSLATLANFFIFSAIKGLGASTASIIEIAYPFFVVLFSLILFRTFPNIYFFIGAILVFAGTAIIIKFS